MATPYRPITLGSSVFCFLYRPAKPTAARDANRGALLAQQVRHAAWAVRPVEEGDARTHAHRER